ncbi:hypothetical protein JHW43_009205 [Diplocarpon mali]|nr:hypothetical protein JHW43_009205 [Diplocarpon mali]
MEAPTMNVRSNEGPSTTYSREVGINSVSQPADNGIDLPILSSPGWLAKLAFVAFPVPHRNARPVDIARHGAAWTDARLFPAEYRDASRYQHGYQHQHPYPYRACGPLGSWMLGIACQPGERDRARAPADLVEATAWRPSSWNEVGAGKEGTGVAARKMESLRHKEDGRGQRQPRCGSCLNGAQTFRDGRRRSEAAKKPGPLGGTVDCERA